MRTCGHKIILLGFLAIFFGIIGTPTSYAGINELEKFSMNPFVPEFHVTALMQRAKKELLDRFGQPLKIESRAGLSPQIVGSTIEKSILQYDGMTIDIETDITSKFNQPSWVRRLHISSSKYVLSNGLSIGATKGRYLEILGNNYRQDQNTITFDVSVYLNHVGTTFHLTQSVSIKFSDTGKSESITWIYHEH